jgi:hypothetical protein
MTTQSSSSRNGAGAAAADLAGHDLVARTMYFRKYVARASDAARRGTRIQEHQQEHLPGYPASRSVRCSWQSDWRQACACHDSASLSPGRVLVLGFQIIL